MNVVDSISVELDEKVVGERIGTASVHRLVGVRRAVWGGLCYDGETRCRTYPLTVSSLVRVIRAAGRSPYLEYDCGFTAEGLFAYFSRAALTQSPVR